MSRLSMLILTLSVCVALSEANPIKRSGHEGGSTTKPHQGKEKESEERDRREIYENAINKRGVNISLPGLLDVGLLNKRSLNASLPGVLDLGVLNKRSLNASLPGVLDLGVLNKRSLNASLPGVLDLGVLNKRSLNASLPGVLDLGVLNRKKKSDMSYLEKRGVNLSLPGLIDVGLLPGKKRRNATPVPAECSDELEDGQTLCKQTPAAHAMEED